MHQMGLQELKDYSSSHRLLQNNTKCYVFLHLHPRKNVISSFDENGLNSG